MSETAGHLLDDLDATLAQWLAARDLPAYRGRQIRQWLFARRAAQWEEMTDLPRRLRDELCESLPIWTTEIERRSQSDDGTEKLLVGLDDGGQIECVLIRDRRRRTFCISTQVGCGMGCVFCASGLDGVKRNLRTGEIVEQMLRLGQLLGPQESVTHIVVIGMGEPLANLDRLLPALSEARREDGLAISARRITVSTVGLPAAIDRLAKTQPRYRLAVSLHAPNDELRNRLVPVNEKIGINEVVAAADRYFDASGRRMTYEYVLLADVNDLPEHAEQLGRLLSVREALLNVIPYNPVTGLPYQTPSDTRQRAFQAILERAGVRVRFRRRKGSRIDAACGQLRRSAAAAKPQAAASGG